MLYEVITRRPVAVLAVCLGLALLSALAATRIVVRTSFWDTMSETEPTIVRIRHLAANFVITSYSIHYTKLYDGIASPVLQC